MNVGYVVLYVTDPEACVNFWVDQMGMELRESTTVGDLAINKVGFRNQQFSFELVPLALMEENPDELDLATPSICFYVEDLKAENKRLKDLGISTTDIAEHSGVESFAFSDNENRWFAVIEGS